MLSNTNILLVRHGEKPGDPGKDDPKDGPNLSPAGWQRAEAYVAYFENFAAVAVDGFRPGQTAAYRLCLCRRGQLSHFVPPASHHISLCRCADRPPTFIRLHCRQELRRPRHPTPV